MGDPGALKARLDEGRPTLVWIALWGDLSQVDYTDDGTGFTLTAGVHVVVAYGYDAGGVYVSDPAIGAKRYYDWGTFSTMWSVLDGMALVRLTDVALDYRQVATNLLALPRALVRDDRGVSGV